MQDPTLPLSINESKQQSNNSLLRPPTSGSWKKGQSGNPNGPPKRDWTFKGVLEKSLEQSAKDGKSYKEHLMNSLLREGLKGNIGAIKEIMNRLDGMPEQKMSVEAQGNWNVSLNRSNA